MMVAAAYSTQPRGNEQPTLRKLVAAPQARTSV